jgi:flagellar brake protein
MTITLNHTPKATMQANLPVLGTENQSPFAVDSRREILALLHGLKDSGQMLSMMIHGGAEVFVTSVLEVDDANSALIIDGTPNEEANHIIAAATPVNFEGLLDKISIQFSASHLATIRHGDHSAFRLPMPRSLIRLQRREHYRINTPIADPILCTITEIDEEGNRSKNLFPIVDISCGGIAILDEYRLLDRAAGTYLDNCSIDLPHVGPIQIGLQVRNSQDLTLLNGKTNRRLGMQFQNLPSGLLASIQRYIMKLERERNAKLRP